MFKFTVTLIGKRKDFAVKQDAETPERARELALERYPDCVVFAAEWVDETYRMVEFDAAGVIVHREGEP